MRVFDNDDSCTVELRVHEQVVLPHVLFDKLLVLLGISTTDHEIVLGGNEPNELFEPENFALH